MADPLPDEDADRELAEAEKEFADETGSNIVDVDVAEPKKEETAERNQQILAALGFKRYEDIGAIKCSIRVLNTKIGVTFNETNMLGKIWAYKIPEGDEEKDFLKNGDLKAHPLIQKYQAIQEGKEAIPETSVTGKVVEKRGKAIKIEIEENGEKKQIFYGQGAVKKDKEGYFLPAGFSKAGTDKEGKEHDAKMVIPRDIRLLDYEAQLKQAPSADTTKEEDDAKEKGELPKKPDEKAKMDLQPTDKSTLADAIYNEPLTIGERSIVPELIAKYVEILAQVTVAIKAEDRIQDREKGYGVKFVYYSVIGEVDKRPVLSEDEIGGIAKAMLNTDISMMGKGGDHKGQA